MRWGARSSAVAGAMLAALAPGRSRFENYSPGADCASTLGCVRELGCNVERDEKGAVVIDGIGAQLKAPASQLDCGNSGSTIRMLSGILAGQLDDQLADVNASAPSGLARLLAGFFFAEPALKGGWRYDGDKVLDGVPERFAQADQPLPLPWRENDSLRQPSPQLLFLGLGELELPD